MSPVRESSLDFLERSTCYFQNHFQVEIIVGADSLRPDHVHCPAHGRACGARGSPPQLPQRPSSVSGSVFLLAGWAEGADPEAEPCLLHNLASLLLLEVASG